MFISLGSLTQFQKMKLDYNHLKVWRHKQNKTVFGFQQVNSIPVMGKVMAKTSDKVFSNLKWRVHWDEMFCSW